MKRILLVDDHQIVREGLKRVLAKDEASFGEASTAEEALKLAREEKWDIAILDLSLAGRSGLEVLKELKQIRPRLPVLILSMHTQVQYARRAFKAGASGYITKDSSPPELKNAIKKVINDGTYVAPALAEKLVVDIRTGIDRPPHESLSNREFEVLQLIASGKTAGEISGILSLSDSTISTYRARILDKMGMKTNAELIYYAVHNRLVE
jgi:two-component system invasion response regulator UvrY